MSCFKCAVTCYLLDMAIAKKITLMWCTKVDGQTRYFPCLFETRQGALQARHGVVKDHGQQVEYPQGRYVLRSYVHGRKVYQNVEGCNPTLAVIALQRARRASMAGGAGVQRD